MWDLLFDWVNGAPIIAVAVIVLPGTFAAAAAGAWLHTRRDRDANAAADSHESHIVSAVIGLLALLMGFTFSLAIERFETRRTLVIEEANAIGTAYLQTQLLGEPHRTRLTKLLIAYTDNVVALAKLPNEQARKKLAEDDKLLNDIWAATAAGFDSIKQLNFSATFVSSINAMMDTDSSRRSERQAHIPGEVFVLLLIYLIGTAGALGYVLGFGRARFAAAFLLLLFSLSLLLIIDIDSSTRGGITEPQGPMEDLTKSLHSQNPTIFDRWREPALKR